MTGLPNHESTRLRSAAAGRSRRDHLTGHELTPEQQRSFEDLARRRAAGEPLQYLEGTVDFGPIELLIDERALIPRPETEQLWELAVAALSEAGPGTVVVDIGTGSGALALALKHAFPAARVFGLDRSAAALSLAAENVRYTGLDVTLLQGDLFEPLPERLRGRIDLVVSNPPYVAEEEWAVLPADVRDHEPREALVAGPEGTEVLARIAEGAYWWLGVGGHVLCEIGETQGGRVRTLFSAFDARIRTDLTGRDRFVVARRGAPCCR
jgi:release factor glutamine methyltransferase